MRIPAVRGLIDRRILANYHMDPEVMEQILPPPFRPKVIHGAAIGGICLIRLKAVRPRMLPLPWGIRSENAAHRFAVEWEADGRLQEGVYIPRRDTDSRLTAFLGGTLFPGIHHHGRFNVEEQGDFFSVAMESDDGETLVQVAGTLTDRLPDSSVFSTVAEVSEFFERGSLGYSATGKAGRYDGLELRCLHWHVDPLEVETVESSFFDDEERFPRGSVEFDCALLMRGIHHEWHGREDLVRT